MKAIDVGGELIQDMSLSSAVCEVLAKSSLQIWRAMCRLGSTARLERVVTADPCRKVQIDVPRAA